MFLRRSSPPHPALTDSTNTASTAGSRAATPAADALDYKPSDARRDDEVAVSGELLKT
jgi:hypothetical protein